MPKASDREAIIDELVRLLREERLRQDRSLSEVSAVAGLSRTMVMRVEKRERLPTIDSLLRITDALQIDLSVFLRAATKKVRD